MLKYSLKEGVVMNMEIDSLAKVIWDYHHMNQVLTPADLIIVLEVMIHVWPKENRALSKRSCSFYCNYRRIG